MHKTYLARWCVSKTTGKRVKMVKAKGKGKKKKCGANAVLHTKRRHR